MNKIKLVKKKGVTHIMIKSLKGQQLNEHEAYAINSDNVPYLLHVDVEMKKNTFKLFYNITGFIPFIQFFQTPFTKSTFAPMLKNILECLLSVKRAYFHQEKMLMDYNQVMVNPNTQKIYFVYVPIQNYNSGISLRDFLLNIIQFCTFSPNEDTSYAQDYINILNNGINFSEFELEQYINNLLGQNNVPVSSKIECPACHFLNDEGINYCIHCGCKITGNASRDVNQIYNPVDPNNNVYQGQNNSGQQRVYKNNTQGLSDGTIDLNSYVGGTTVLGSGELERPTVAFLLRLKNNKKIIIDKPTFSIGKERGNCNYIIVDNKAVSRNHAKIVTKGKRYYVVDLGSTNHTYVDGHKIPEQTEVEIFSKTKVRLANEEFVFCVEDSDGDKNAF